MQQRLYLSIFKSISFGLVLMPLLICSCNQDPLDVPDQPLQGVIDNIEWQGSSANAYLQTNGQYLVRFLSDEEAVSDPCTLVQPVRTHVKALFRPVIGNFIVSTIAVDDNQVQVAFQLSPSTSLIATSGFLEIFDINNSVAVGYLQAQEGDNTVEGTFSISICN